MSQEDNILTASSERVTVLDDFNSETAATPQLPTFESNIGLHKLNFQSQYYLLHQNEKKHDGSVLRSKDGKIKTKNPLIHKGQYDIPKKGVQPATCGIYQNTRGIEVHKETGNVNVEYTYCKCGRPACPECGQEWIIETVFKNVVKMQCYKEAYNVPYFIPFIVQYNIKEGDTKLDLEKLKESSKSKLKRDGNNAFSLWNHAFDIDPRIKLTITTLQLEGKYKNRNSWSLIANEETRKIINERAGGEYETYHDMVYVRYHQHGLVAGDLNIKDGRKTAIASQYDILPKKDNEGKYEHIETMEEMVQISMYNLGHSTVTRTDGKSDFKSYGMCDYGKLNGFDPKDKLETNRYNEICKEVAGILNKFYKNYTILYNTKTESLFIKPTNAESLCIETIDGIIERDLVLKNENMTGIELAEMIRNEMSNIFINEEIDLAVPEKIKKMKSIEKSQMKSLCSDIVKAIDKQNQTYDFVFDEHTSRVFISEMMKETEEVEIAEQEGEKEETEEDGKFCPKCGKTIEWERKEDDVFANVLIDYCPECGYEKEYICFSEYLRIYPHTLLDTKERLYGHLIVYKCDHNKILDKVKRVCHPYVYSWIKDNLITFWNMQENLLIDEEMQGKLFSCFMRPPFENEKPYIEFDDSLFSLRGYQKINSLNDYWQFLMNNRDMILKNIKKGKVS